MTYKPAAAALAVALSMAVPASAATVFTNVNGYTLDGVGQLQTFDTLVVSDDGRVSRTMSSPTDLPSGDVVDMDERTMLPGLIDGHGHVMGLGQQLSQLDLSQTTSLDEALAAIRDYAEANPELEWITGRGWNQENWALGRFPTAVELDTVVADRPVFLERVDGHAAWVNGEALRRGAVTAATLDPDGGRIERLPDGNPEGVLVDTAQALVALPMPTEEQRALWLDRALAKMASVGLTGVADMGTSPVDWQMMNRYGANGRLTARIAAYAGGMQSLEAIAPNGPTGWQYDDRLALVGVKLYGDGALGSRGAALLEPYSDAPDETGLLFVEGAELRNKFVSAARRGHQIAFHAIGDAANREALDAFADVLRYAPGGRHRVEHAQIVAIEDLPRFAEIGIIASMQQTHATSDKNMAEDRVGPDRIRGGYAWQTMLETGARFAGGSDFPVEPSEPLYGLHAAVTRQDRSGDPDGGWYAGEAQTLEQALASFTTGAAYANQAERMVGTLTPGKYADFIILASDPFAVDPVDSWSIEVEETWLAGEKVFDAD
ncbi:MAG: amidohydrolase [Pacificimonas sp.]